MQRTASNIPAGLVDLSGDVALRAFLGEDLTPDIDIRRVSPVGGD
jgi:hypothetical protein